MGAKVIPHTRHRRETKQDRQKRVGQAIRDARMRAGLTQDGLGELLAPILSHDLVPQTTISRWEVGSVSIDLEQLRAVEIALQLPAGTLFTNSGYCESSLKAKDVENAIRSDRNLDDGIRDAVITTYRSAVTLSKRIKDAERRNRRNGRPASTRRAAATA